MFERREGKQIVQCVKRGLLYLVCLCVCVCVCVCIDNRAFVTRLVTCGFTWIHAPPFKCTRNLTAQKGKNQCTIARSY